MQVARVTSQLQHNKFQVTRVTRVTSQLRSYNTRYFCTMQVTRVTMVTSQLQHNTFLYHIGYKSYKVGYKDYKPTTAQYILYQGLPVNYSTIYFCTMYRLQELQANYSTINFCTMQVSYKG